MPQRYLPRQARIAAANHKGWQQVAERRFQIEQAALEEQHRRSGRRNHLGETGNIVACAWSHCLCAAVVDEVAQRVLKDHRIPSKEAESAAGKCLVCNSPVQNGVDFGKARLRPTFSVF